jgi:hypothetical protein
VIPAFQSVQAIGVGIGHGRSNANGRLSLGIVVLGGRKVDKPLLNENFTVAWHRAYFIRHAESSLFRVSNTCSHLVERLDRIHIFYQTNKYDIKAPLDAGKRHKIHP